LRVVEEAGRTSARHRLVRVQCDCGTEKVVAFAYLRNGDTRSCGCLHRDQLKARLTSHGKSNSREYRIWSGMLRRCTNQKAANYENYGGRGISVCERWRNFENFYADMGVCPDGHSIDRKNNDSNYEPGNCRWATRTEQNNNSRHNNIVTYRGEQMSLAEAVRRAGKTSRGVAASRISRFNWSVERAVETPSGKVGAKHDRQM
jgi:hypothetical protein